MESKLKVNFVLESKEIFCLEYVNSPNVLLYFRDSQIFFSLEEVMHKILSENLLLLVILRVQ